MIMYMHTWEFAGEYGLVLYRPSDVLEGCPLPSDCDWLVPGTYKDIDEPRYAPRRRVRQIPN